MAYSAGQAANEEALVESAIGNAEDFADTAKMYGLDSPAMDAWADYGGRLGFIPNLFADDEAKAEVKEYNGRVDPKASAWMDNTTIVGSVTLLSEQGGKFLT